MHPGTGGTIQGGHVGRHARHTGRLFSWKWVRARLTGTRWLSSVHTGIARSSWIWCRSPQWAVQKDQQVPWNQKARGRSGAVKVNSAMRLRSSSLPTGGSELELALCHLVMLLDQEGHQAQAA